MMNLNLALKKKSECNKRSIVILVSFILVFLAVGLLAFILNNNSNEKRINELNSLIEKQKLQIDSLTRIEDSLYSIIQQYQKTEEESFYMVDVTSDDDKYEYGSEDYQDQVTETEETVIDDINLTPIHPKDSIKD